MSQFTPLLFFSACEWRMNMLDNLVSVRSGAQVEPFTANYNIIEYNGLTKVCPRELIYAGRAHPSYSQVTLERSDFRTDFRTRLKNKQCLMNGSAQLTLPFQGITSQNHQYDIRTQAWYMQLSPISGPV